ncbi:hypothetical protein E5843_05070 [Luteimonas yindakuii]|uniref:hypothetical protein n=1 Tax=Luteimonas yindakuii TaxID=2565782 RepID=UPI0010A35472|nr:hypothetical protein [Luteimonas yindakuii]QCO67310.1 hypothetical protein E5843_05070 [Luteimonas yindakuii]
MGGFDPWQGLVLLLLVAIPAAVILAMVWLLRRNRGRPAALSGDHGRATFDDAQARAPAISRVD